MNTVKKLRPRTEIHEYLDMEFKLSSYGIDYYCPICEKRIPSYKSDIACDKCGTFFDWGEHEPTITRTVVW